MKSEKGKANLPTVRLKIGPVTYTEREIPDDSPEALAIKAKLEREGNEIYEAVVTDIRKSGFFNQDMLPELEKRIEGLKRGAKWQLPAKEIKQYLSALGLQQEKPGDILKYIHLQNQNKLYRKRALAEMKRDGVKKVEISIWDDDGDCPKIQKLKKVWPIDKVPDFPLPGCTAKYCRCEYLPVDSI